LVCSWVWRVLGDVGTREEGREKREEGRGKREEGRRKKEEGRGKRETNWSSTQSSPHA
jgi:hypothetical protein